jgi:hypothetical protein
MRYCVLGAHLRGMVQFHLAKRVEAKIYYVDAHHDEQRRDYGKFNQGITRDSICSDQEGADSAPRRRTRSPKNRFLSGHRCSFHQRYRTRGSDRKRADAATFVFKASNPNKLNLIGNEQSTIGGATRYTCKRYVTTWQVDRACGIQPGPCVESEIARQKGRVSILVHHQAGGGTRGWRGQIDSAAVLH